MLQNLIKRRQNKVRITAVFFKMAGVIAEYYIMVKMNLFMRRHKSMLEKESNMSLRIGQANLSSGSLFGITRGSHFTALCRGTLQSHNFSKPQRVWGCILLVTHFDGARKL